ncbi:MAG: hypothetical protein L6R30_09650 [Thermoanaerobaculia bacterium]|nr:hypothetical protein [Myxococcota bacterium]MCK6682665.1 hypothetical protein [Thermoanaerobaculia bacterium]
MELGCKSERNREHGSDLAAVPPPQGGPDETGQMRRAIKNDSREVRVDGRLSTGEPSLCILHVAVAETELRASERRVERARVLGDNGGAANVIVEAGDPVAECVRTPAAAPHPMASDLEDLLAL